jgi:hypothetical protein
MAFTGGYRPHRVENPESHALLSVKILYGKQRIAPCLKN